MSMTVYSHGDTDDTHPSGERESGSYSGTRQRNRIQFGLSQECSSG